MRIRFVVLWALACSACSPAGLPGFPLVAPGEAEGPRHIQTLVAIEEESVLLMESVESDGRPARMGLLRVDRRGEILERMPSPASASPADGKGLKPLPKALADRIIDVTKERGSYRILLRESGEVPAEASLAVLPGARSIHLEGVALGPPGKDGEPNLAVVAWNSRRKGSLVRGLVVLDLMAGRARLHQVRGIAAHLEGRFEESARLFLEAWESDPEDPLGAYNLACALVRLGREERALTYLWHAVKLDGPRIRVLAAQDPDLDALRSHPDFESLAGPGGLLRLRDSP